MQYAVFAWQNGTGLVDLWRAGFAYRPERQVPPGVGYTVIGLNEAVANIGSWSRPAVS